jgi:hypothetical protein
MLPACLLVCLSVALVTSFLDLFITQKDNLPQCPSYVPNQNSQCLTLSLPTDPLLGTWVLFLCWIYTMPTRTLCSFSGPSSFISNSLSALQSHITIKGGSLTNTYLKGEAIAWCGLNMPINIKVINCQLMVGTGKEIKNPGKGPDSQAMRSFVHTIKEAHPFITPHLCYLSDF